MAEMINILIIIINAKNSAVPKYIIQTVRSVCKVISETSELLY